MKTALQRRTLLKLAAIASLGPAGISGWIQKAIAKGDLPTVPGVNAVSGSVSVNGVPAKTGTPVRPGDRVTTGAASQAVVVVGKDAFLIRDNGNVVFEASPRDPSLLNQVLVVTGRVLSVFAKRNDASLGLKTSNATIGIRGTGAYLQVEDGRTYFCLCYGEAAVSGKGMAAPSIIKTTHHESPVWLDDRGSVMKIEKAPMISHTDDELILLEKLVGREPPFVALGLAGRY